MKTILVTGAAGFIGANLVLRLLDSREPLAIVGDHAAQLGDVHITYADATAPERDFGFVPKVTLREGLGRFAERYKGYYG